MLWRPVSMKHFRHFCRAQRVQRFNEYLQNKWDLKKRKKKKPLRPSVRSIYADPQTIHRHDSTLNKHFMCIYKVVQSPWSLGPVYNIYRCTKRSYNFFGSRTEKVPEKNFSHFFYAQHTSFVNTNNVLSFKCVAYLCVRTALCECVWVCICLCMSLWMCVDQNIFIKNQLTVAYFKGEFVLSI